jgi:hypothetical protein
MAVKRVPITYKGRSLGIIVLTSAQILIGIIHAIFGFLLLASENTLLKATVTYDFYTIAFGVLTLVFAWFIWQGKKSRMDRHYSDFRLCQHCRCFGCFEFANYPRNPKVRGANRNNLQPCSHNLPISKAYKKKIFGKPLSEKEKGICFLTEAKPLIDS